MRVNPRTLNEPLFDLPHGRTQILMLSMRNASDLVGYTGLYEFEDLIAELTGAEVGHVRNLDAMLIGRKLYYLVKDATGSRKLASAFAPKFGRVELNYHYDLFFPLFNHSLELFTLSALRGWRRRCRFAACYIAEAWVSELSRYPLELLREFDHIFVGVRGAVEAITRATGRPCTYVPRGVDALRFCPYPNAVPRAIDVCNIGRRSEVTHQRLLERASRGDFFYYYDTSQVSFKNGSSISFTVSNPREHRLWLAALLKRSRYLLASRAYADQPMLTQGQEEIPGRFYEGAAAGTLMLGEPPKGEAFQQEFGWAGSVIPMPYDAPDVQRVIEALDRDPTRTEEIRRQNVRNTLLKHDWVYHLRTILEQAGQPIPPRMLEREQALRARASQLDGAH